MVKNKIALEYIGNHNKRGIYFVGEDKKEDLINSGNYKMPGKILQSTNKSKFITEKHGKCNSNKE